MLVGLEADGTAPRPDRRIDDWPKYEKSQAIP